MNEWTYICTPPYALTAWRGNNLYMYFLYICNISYFDIWNDVRHRKRNICWWNISKKKKNLKIVKVTVTVTVNQLMSVTAKQPREAICVRLFVWLCGWQGDCSWWMLSDTVCLTTSTSYTSKQPSTYEKRGAASVVLGSRWWAVCRPKHVELHINME
jgi:hypothetical protein